MTVNTFRNRDIAWTEFYNKVYAQISSSDTPQIDKYKFMSICSSILDEFISVRYAYIRNMINSGVMLTNDSFEQYDDILDKIEEFLDVSMTNLDNISMDDMYLGGEISENILSSIVETNPMLKLSITPMVLDRNRELPLLTHGEQYLFGEFKQGGERKVFLAPIPEAFPKYFYVSNTVYNIRLIAMQILSEMFEDRECRITTIKVLRDFSKEVELTDSNIKTSVAQMVNARKSAPIVAVLLGTQDKHIKKLIKKYISDDALILRNPDLIDGIEYALDDITTSIKIHNMLLPESEPKPAISYEEILSPIHRYQGQNIMKKMAKHDIVLFHPYEKYDTVIQFISEAAKDPDVICIKQTLYRADKKQSKIVDALCTAARNGIHVFVLIEATARFDEQNNLTIGKLLEDAGCLVGYGMNGIKCHGKTTLAIKKTADGFKSYAHIGTGNYNESTSSIYSDISLLTCNPVICEDLSRVFQYLSSGIKFETNAVYFKPGSIATLIEEEITRVAMSTENREIFIKCNAINDLAIMNKLIDAARAGVKVTMNIRSINCMPVGVPNLTMFSIVGPYLEHSRIYKFGTKTYISSSDLLVRNTKKRFELFVPVDNKRIDKMIEMYSNPDIENHQLAIDEMIKE